MAFILLLLLPSVALGFGIGRETTLNHQEITKRAVLNITVKACHEKAQTEGKSFTAPNEPYTIENVLQACQIQRSTKAFYESLNLIEKSIILAHQSTSPASHFYNEEFTAGRDIIAVGLGAVKASTKLGNSQSAIYQLGKVFHTLQDFYCNSNWLEIGEVAPNAKLLKGNSNLGTIADKARATCRNCDENSCVGNILDDIITGKILTSAYFGNKPAGKCSQGGPLDASRNIEPRGGISKDRPDSRHGYLHEAAAQMAVKASSELLDDVLQAAGSTAFLQMIGASSGKTVCFVMDTTGSMTQEIEGLQFFASEMVTLAAAGSQSLPSVYMLVPFKDPSFGPVTTTTDPSVFKAAADKLSASAGGDNDENSLSALQLALTAASPGTEVFLFTDASAKDMNLKDSVIALSQSKKCPVTTVWTGPVNSLSDIQLCEDLASAAGGKCLRVGKSQFPLVLDVIKDSFMPTPATLLKEAGNQGNNEAFTFVMDDTIKSCVAYVTGATSNVVLEKPSGDTVTPTLTLGNFKRWELAKDVGLWKLRVQSNNPYTAKVDCDSDLTFLYSFVGPDQIPQSQPQADVKNSLELTLLGSETARVTEVYLQSPGSGQVSGTLTSVGNKEYLVEFDSMPTDGFAVFVKGETGDVQTSSFQRMLAYNVKPSTLSITVDDQASIIEPGTTLSVPFTVSSNNKGDYPITVSNDQGFTTNVGSTLSLTGSSATGNVLISVPSKTQTGTAVTIVIRAQAPTGTDSNYAVTSFIILQKVTDFSFPECKVLTQTDCTQTCSRSAWQVNLQIKDSTGVESVRHRLGNGSLITRLAAGEIRLVTYNASCCSPQVEVVVVDTVGNVGIYPFAARVTSSTTTVTASSNSTGTASGCNSPHLVHSLFYFILSLWAIRVIG